MQCIIALTLSAIMAMPVSTAYSGYIENTALETVELRMMEYNPE